mmetsp:Transcript_105630/g.297147  ORF Transcript_105630/g.297147 Transcript_105630/m.297147 type:complete len:220 (-) Transcript_105630:758-1417(-)
MDHGGPVCDAHVRGTDKFRHHALVVAAHRNDYQGAHSGHIELETLGPGTRPCDSPRIFLVNVVSLPCHSRRDEEAEDCGEQRGLFHGGHRAQVGGELAAEVRVPIRAALQQYGLNCVIGTSDLLSCCLLEQFPQARVVAPSGLDQGMVCACVPRDSEPGSEAFDTAEGVLIRRSCEQGVQCFRRQLQAARVELPEQGIEALLPASELNQLHPDGTRDRH